MKKYIGTMFVVAALTACSDQYYLPPVSAAPTGPQGAVGQTGSSSTSCTVANVTGGAQVACGTASVFIANGSNGTNGNDGTNGSDGTDGTNGTNGSNGIDATPITVVQLCAPSFVPSYPSVFPEVALCIDNNLYGVYSANGGFFSELTPGTYSSDGINSSCTLTVGPNCQVSN